jgi:hypothetical protein
MNAPPLTLGLRGVLRYSRWDALPVGLAAAHGLLLLWVPAAPVIALGLWWNSNTVSHHFLHTPFFHSPTLNRLFSCYLSVLLGIPQALWRQRHFAHHAGVPWRLCFTGQVLLETALVLALWAVLLAWQPKFFLAAYLPGYVGGLLLCSLHGYYEHAPETVSHYGTLYNLFFFNDGFHVEHHTRPSAHWTRLREQARPGAEASPWPAVLRWLELFSLDGLERCVLHSGRLQRFVLKQHEQAFRRLLSELSARPRVAIVGGGLFPRTLLILRRLLPHARIVVIDRSARNIATARDFLRTDVEFLNEVYDPSLVRGCDLVVFPLAFVGDRSAIYRHPPANLVVTHDWIWRPRGTSAIISFLLLKRLNLVRP